MNTNSTVCDATVKIFLIICLVLNIPVLANEQTNETRSDNNTGIENSTNAESKTVTSIEALTNRKDVSADTLGFVATYVDRNGNNIDQAIALCRQSLKRNNDDIDVHQHYAELLESKISEQAEIDPSLYNECIKQWLIVLRNEVGDQKGETFHGIGLPFIGFVVDDDDRENLARNHLTHLTGIEPKGWETDAKYIQKVAKRNSVKGKLLAEKKMTDRPNKN